MSYSSLAVALKSNTPLCRTLRVSTFKKDSLLKEREILFQLQSKTKKYLVELRDNNGVVLQDITHTVYPGAQSLIFNFIILDWRHIQYKILQRQKFLRHILNKILFHFQN